MKKSIIIFLLMLPCLLVAQQKFSDGDVILINSRVDSLLSKFMEAGTLKRPGETKRSDAVCKEFRKLFMPDAKVYDDINPEFNENAQDFPYKLKVKDFLEYYDGLVDEFPTGLIIANRKINVSYVSFNDSIVTVAIERFVDGVKSTKHHFYNEDTLKIIIRILKDKTVKISEISLLGTGAKFRVINDKDNDNVVDSDDKCPEFRGKILLEGCPDTDNDGIPDKDDDCIDLPGPRSNDGCPPSTFAYRFVFTGSLGFQMNNNTINEIQMDGFGYQNMDKTLSKPGTIENPGLDGSLALSANVAYYFGKNRNNRNKGISFGFSVTHYTASYDITDAEYQFQSNDGADDYRRIVKANTITEELGYTIFNFPLMLRIKSKINAKWAWELSAGPSLMTVLTTSTSSANFSFEGIYQHNSSGFFYDPFYDRQSSDVLLTSNFIESRTINPNANPDAAIVYQLLSERNAGYDFAVAIPVSEALDIDARSGFALNAGAELIYHMTADIALKGMFTFITAPTIPHKTTSYKMMDKTTDTYGSIYNSKASSTYTSFGLHFGIILGI